MKLFYEFTSQDASILEFDPPTCDAKYIFACRVITFYLRR